MSFRYVRWSTWTKIKALFPNAIEFKRKRIGFPEDLGDDVDNDLCGCMQCRANGIAQTCLRSNLSDFTQFCQGSRNCEALANEVVLEMSKLQGSTAQFRLLHKADMLAWRKFVAAFKRKDDKKRNESLEEMVKKALFPSSSNNASRCFPLNQLNNKPARVDLQRLEFLSKIFRPIVCKTHGRPIYDALFQVVDNPANQKYGFLTDNICILDENDYKDFLAYVVAVAVILFPSDKNLISEGSMVHAFTSEAAIFSDTWRIDSVSHPTFVPVPLNGDQRDSDLFCVSTENLAMVFQLDGASCHDEICCRDFAHWLASEGTLEEPKVSPLEVRTKEQPESLGVVNDPITVDSDFESGSVTEPFSLRVFDVKADSDLDLALEALSRCTGLLTSEEADENQFLRRSSRKRKSRYPVGVIQDEETVRADMNNNIAALRLLLLERCTKGSQFELDHTLRLVLRTCAKDEGQIVVDLDGGKEEDVISSTQFLSKVKVVDLTFNLNCETLRSICEEAVGEKMEQSINQSESIMLLRQASEDNSSKAIPKDAMMDHFIGLANTTAEVSSTGKRPCSNTALNKKSRTEKGFTGTFLSSTALSKATDIIEEASAEPTKVVKHADAHLNCNEGYSPSEPLKPTVSVMEGSMHVLVDAVDLYARQEVSIIEDNRIVEHDKRTWNEESYRRTDLYDNKGKTTEPGSDTQSFVKDTNPVTELLTSSKVVESDNVFSHSNSSKYFNELKPEAASTSGEVRQCLTNSHKPNGSRAQSRDFFEDNSDDEIELLRSPFTKVSPQRWASKRTRRTTVTGKVSVLVATSQKPDDCPDRGRRQSTKDHNLVSEIVRMLLSNPDIQRKDKQMCQMAAENAIQMHPEVKDANRLVDPAYSLYLEFTLP